MQSSVPGLCADRFLPLSLTTSPQGAFLGLTYHISEWFCPPTQGPGLGWAVGALQASSQTWGEIPAGTSREARAGVPQAHCPMLLTPRMAQRKAWPRRAGDSRGGSAGTSFPPVKGKEQVNLRELPSLMGSSNPWDLLLTQETTGVSIHSSTCKP